MKVINFDIKLNLKSSTLIVGAFEAIHIGHLQLIKEAKKNLSSIAVLLFDNPNKLPFKSSEKFESLEVRLQKLANLKINYAIIMKVNNETLSLTPEKFIHKLKAYNFKRIISGTDFRFGFQRKGSVDLLKNHFDTKVVKLKKKSNMKIASSFIKEQISFGDLELANTLTVSPWTTNVTLFRDNYFVLLDDQVKPHSGFYAVTIIVNNIMYHGVVHVTRKKKFIIYPLNNKENLQNKNVIISWWKQIVITIKDNEDKIKKEYLEFANIFFKNSL